MMPADTARWAMWRARAARTVHLSFRDWLLLGEAAFTLTVVWLALKFRRFDRVVQSSVRVRAAGGGCRLSPEGAGRLSRFVRAAADNHVCRLACLPRSLALARMISRRGAPAEVKLGVSLAGGTLQAHAWVETNGERQDPGGSAAAFHQLGPVSAGRRQKQEDIPDA